MKFGFDIDDTLIGLREHAFHIYQRKLNQQVEQEKFDQLDRVEIHELFSMNDQEGKQMWEDSLEEIYFTNCPLYPGALETIQQLEERGHEIYYITARPKQHGEQTKAWLRENGFPVLDSHFFYGMKDNEKVEIIQHLDLDYYVDDKPGVLDTLAKTNTNLLIKDQSYNRNFKSFPRIIDWHDFLQNKMPDNQF
ncbi:5' nucleotidase, NT5C type [Oceanobacillus sp. 1P07AA]|uniref:5' nucleotidase, NT5C type n=1 Tax=Oceanobacillus sp. 1P07AA TaxID=3132293 RepID=UPI0039A463B6